MRKLFLAAITSVGLLTSSLVQVIPAYAVTSATGQTCTIIGNNNAQTLTGTTGKDVICGLGGNDVINGLGGNDIIDGGQGNDTISGGLGNDVLVGGQGTDNVSYSDAPAGVAVDLSKTVQQNTVSSGLDTINEFENIIGGNGNDILTGDVLANVINAGNGNDVVNAGVGNDVLVGGPGTDTLNGGNGVDTASYANASAGVAVDLSITTQQFTVSAGYDTLVADENVVGGNGNDILSGDNGANQLSGSGGSDSLLGQNGNDTLQGGQGFDSFDGGLGLNSCDITADSGELRDWTCSLLPELSYLFKRVTGQITSPNYNFDGCVVDLHATVGEQAGARVSGGTIYDHGNFSFDAMPGAYTVLIHPSNEDPSKCSFDDYWILGYTLTVSDSTPRISIPIAAFETIVINVKNSRGAPLPNVPVAYALMDYLGSSSPTNLDVVFSSPDITVKTDASGNARISYPRGTKIQARSQFVIAGITIVSKNYVGTIGVNPILNIVIG